MSDRPDVAAAIAAAARTMHQHLAVEDTLLLIADTARSSIPGFDHAGISTIDRHGTIVTRAATGQVVWDLDRIQYGLNQGPCVDALHDQQFVAVPEIRHDQRWPKYVQEAARFGLRSQLAVKLYLDDEGTLGGLNMYSMSRDDLDPDAVALADLFAAHAALALGYAREVANLNEALHSRKAIGQALGILMERYSIDEDHAFGFLVRVSSHTNVKLRDVAQELVDDMSRRVKVQEN